MPASQFGDAITNHVLRIHALLQARGIESHVFAHDHDEFHAGDNEGENLYRRFYRRQREDLLIYHYSVYNDNYHVPTEQPQPQGLRLPQHHPPGSSSPIKKSLQCVEKVWSYCPD